MTIKFISGVTDTNGKPMVEIMYKSGETLPDAALYAVGSVAYNVDTQDVYMSNGTTWVSQS